jgi:DNA-binding transcriptional LysR family regulator
MTYIQIKYFVTIARLRHYTKASEVLNVSQPSLSYAMTSLEEELGFKLFEKEGRNIVLTQEGEIFLKYANESLVSIDNGKATVQIFRQQRESVINLGATTLMGIHFVPGLIKSYYKETGKRDVTLNIQQQHSNKMAEDLKMGSVEIAFGPHLDDPDIEAIELYREKVYLAVSKDHFLAEKKSVVFDDFKNLKIVTFLKPAGIREQIDSYYHKNGCEPRISYEVTNEMMVSGIIEAVSGIGILPCSSEEEYPNLKILEIEDSNMYRPLYMMKLRHLHFRPITGDFWDFVISKTQQKEKGFYS